MEKNKKEEKENKERKVIIIGSGPAGLGAAIYTARAHLNPLVLAGMEAGGQLMWTTKVENYPGFPEGVDGPELMMRMMEQAENFGAELKQEDVVEVDFQKTPFKVCTEKDCYQTESVIVASGASPKWLGVPGEKEFTGKGVSTCATCDAAFFKDEKVIVVGGGDSAMEEALVLSKFASSVTIMVRSGKLKASKIMQQRAQDNEKIEFMFHTEVAEIMGEKFVEKVKLKNNETGEESGFETKAVFIAIGHEPNTDFLTGQVELNERGYVKDKDHVFTNVEGVFVGGDVEDFRYRQAVTAAGFGVMAALEAERFLEENRL